MLLNEQVHASTGEPSRSGHSTAVATADLIEFSTAPAPHRQRTGADDSPSWSMYTVSVLRDQADRLSQTAQTSLEAVSDAQRLALECVTRRRYDEMVRLAMVALGAFGIGLGAGASLILALT